MKWIINAGVFAFACLICLAWYGDNGARKSYGGGEKDIVEAFYSDVVDKNSELSQLEKDLQGDLRNAYEMEARFSAYNRPTTDYYTTADHKLNGIRDTELRAKAKSWIDASRTQYLQRIEALSNLLRMLQEKKVTAADYHTLLKIALTLPVIEKYQQQNMPNQAEYQKALDELNAVIKKMQDNIRR